MGEKYKSHYCCWEQKGENKPACGINLENHKQCCLCPKPFEVAEEEKCDCEDGELLERVEQCPIHKAKWNFSTQKDSIDNDWESEIKNSYFKKFPNDTYDVPYYEALNWFFSEISILLSKNSAKERETSYDDGYMYCLKNILPLKIKQERTKWEKEKRCKLCGKDHDPIEYTYV
jgi:hypothetical protein